MWTQERGWLALATIDSRSKGLARWQAFGPGRRCMRHSAGSKGPRPVRFVPRRDKTVSSLRSRNEKDAPNVAAKNKRAANECWPPLKELVAGAGFEPTTFGL